MYVEIANMIDGVVPHYEYSNKMLVVNMSYITNYVQPKTVFQLDMFRVLAIEMVEDVQLVHAPRLLTDVTHDDDVFKGVISLIMVKSKHVDHPQLSFDVMLGFVSHTNDAPTLSTYVDMSPFSIHMSLVMMIFFYMHFLYTHHRCMTLKMSICNMIQMMTPLLLLIRAPLMRKFHLPQETLRL